MLHRGDLNSLYREQGERVLALAFQMTGDRALAADVLQETFARAWKHRRTFEDRAEASTWLFRIAIRESIRARSKRSARARRERGGGDCRGEPNTHDPTRTDPTKTDPTTSDPESNEDRARLARALDAISDDHRAVLTLLTLRGLTAERVGEILGVPPNTVYSRAAAARRALRARLGD